tara:strand:+ start:211 stop:444 length:234 start_codon:yes stop_codon:yes gene_type:complete
MNDIVNILTSKQRKELEELTVAMTEEAVSVKLDYEQSGSNLDSGSLVAIHQESTLLKDESEKLGDIAFNITPKEKDV